MGEVKVALVVRRCCQVGPDDWDWSTRVLEAAPGETVESLVLRVYGGRPGKGDLGTLVVVDEPKGADHA